MIKILGLLFFVILLADVWINDKQIINSSITLLKRLWEKLKSISTQFLK